MTDEREHDALGAFARLGVAMRTGAVLAGRASGLTLSQYLVLSHLALEDGLTPSELARRLAMSSGGLTPALAQLEARALVEREAHPSDGRSAIVRVTDEGREAVYGHAAPLVGDLAAPLEALDDVARTALTTVLDAWADAYVAHGDRLRASIAAEGDDTP